MADDPGDRDAPPVAIAPKSGSGGLGGLIGSILRGLEPTVRRVLRSRAGTTGGGKLLSVRYREGTFGDWETARVAYGRRGNRIAVISSSDARWWRHVQSGRAVQVRVRNRWVDGHARVLSRDEDTYARAVGIFVEDRSRAAARRLGVPMDDHGRLDRGERRSGDAVVVWIEVESSA